MDVPYKVILQRRQNFLRDPFKTELPFLHGVYIVFPKHSLVPNNNTQTLLFFVSFSHSVPSHPSLPTQGSKLSLCDCWEWWHQSSKLHREEAWIWWYTDHRRNCADRARQDGWDQALMCQLALAKKKGRKKRLEKTTQDCKEQEMTWQKMCENFSIGALSLEAVCSPWFYLITIHRGAWGQSIYYLHSFQVLLLFSSPEKSHHSSLSTANSVICSTVTSDKSERNKR